MEQVTYYFENILSELVPLAVLAVLAAALPILVQKLMARLIRRFGPHLPEWLRILLAAYERPLKLVVRGYLLTLLLFFLPLPFNGDGYKLVITTLFHTFAIVMVGWGAWLAAPMCRLLLRSAGDKLDMATSQTMIRFFENIFRALVVLFTVIALLDCYGVPVTGLLTGAGVAGLAVSLAAQSTLSNLIAGITLVVERPFGIGDYVVLSNYEGTVEDVSFRSTKLRTLDNSVITVENSKVCAEYIQNVTDRTTRRWEFTLGVTYDTGREKLELLCAHLRELLAADPEVDKEHITVTVNAFGASSIDILVRIYVTALAPAAYFALQNRINLNIIDLMKRDECEFAFPSTSIYLGSGVPQ